MSWLITKTIEHLERKRKIHQDALTRITSSIESLQVLNAMNGNAGEVKETLPEPTPKKAFVGYKEKHDLRFKYEEIDPITASIAYIRKAGRAVPTLELFDNFCELGGYPKANRKKYYPRFYQRLHDRGIKMGLMREIKHTVHGKKAFFYVNSEATVTDVRA